MDIRTSQIVTAPGAMESLEKQLSCPICLEMFTKPVVILPCQHNLCRGCASDLYDSRNPYHFSGGVFRCPTCRFEVVLDRHGVYGLQRNLLVENIIDIYKQQQESKGGQELEPPMKDKDAKEPTCQEHEEERINIYCLTCQMATCSMCKVFGQHKDCEVTTLDSVYAAHKTELRNAVDKLAAGNSCVQLLVGQMEDMCRAIEENCQKQRQSLGEKFDHLYAVLEERKGQLLEKIHQEEEEKIQVLRSLAQQHKEQLQTSTVLKDSATQSLEISGVAEFLLKAKQLIAQTQDAAKNAHTERPEVGYENMDHLTLVTEDIEAVLANMDFGTVEGDDSEEEEEEE